MSFVQSPCLVDMLHRMNELDVIPQHQVALHMYNVCTPSPHLCMCKENKWSLRTKFQLSHVFFPVHIQEYTCMCIPHVALPLQLHDCDFRMCIHS